MRRTPPAVGAPSGVRFWHGLICLAGIGSLALGLYGLGQWTHARVKDHDRYLVSLIDVRCPPHPHLSTASFLEEVQAVCASSGRFSILEPDVARNIAEAFRRHPDVASVESVRVGSVNDVEIKLGYRLPVLEIMSYEQTPSGSQSPSASLRPSKPGGGPAPQTHSRATSASGPDPAWWVDGEGRVLPRRLAKVKLPLFFARRSPTGGLGEVYGDPEVTAMARTASFIAPEQGVLQLRVFEYLAGKIVLSTPAGSRVIWGRAPSLEGQDEASARLKLDRLLAYCKAHGSLDAPAGRYEHNVGPAAKAAHTPLPKKE